MEKKLKYWFKEILIVLVIVIFALYYFLWKLPQNKEINLTNQIKCQQKGTELLEKQQSEATEVEKYFGTEFKFNKELNTCLYKGKMSMSNNGVNYSYSFIIDVYTNKELASSGITKINNETTYSGDRSVEEYNLFENKYFPK